VLRARWLALPFWPWGPAATHNATVLLSLTLSGYAMYLLARALGFARGVALFAGTLLLLSPMSLADVQAHLTKVFLATLPLTLLALLLSGPLLAALVLTTRNAALGVEVDLAFEAQFSPDALSLSLPSYFNALLGEHVRPIMERYAIPLDMDHAIFLPWFRVLLCIIGLLSLQRRRSRLWVFFTLECRAGAAPCSLAVDAIALDVR